MLTGLGPSPAACPGCKLAFCRAAHHLPDRAPACSCSRDMKGAPLPSHRGDWASCSTNPSSLRYFPCRWGLFPLLLGDELMGFLPTSLPLLLLPFHFSLRSPVIQAVWQGPGPTAPLASRIILLLPLSLHLGALRPVAQCVGKENREVFSCRTVPAPCC